MDKKTLIIFGIIFSVSTVVAYDYFNRIDRPNLKIRIEVQQSIITGTSDSPYRYRILVPFLTEAASKKLLSFMEYPDAFQISYAVYDFCAIFFILLTLYIYLNIWWTKEQSLIGCLFASATITIALRDHYFQPWSLLETALFTLSLVLIYKEYYGLLCLVIIIATLNKETAIFIPLAYFFTRIDLKNKTTLYHKHIFLICIFFLIWLIPFLILRYLLLGISPHIHSMKELFTYNWTAVSANRAVLNVWLFLGFFWVFAVLESSMPQIL